MGLPVVNDPRVTIVGLHRRTAGGGGIENAQPPVAERYRSQRECCFVVGAPMRKATIHG